MRKLFFLLFCYLLFPYAAQSQQVELKGKVLDATSKLPLIGVSVSSHLQGSGGFSGGGFSDKNGSFSFFAQDTALTLKVEYAEYEPYTQTFTKSVEPITIFLTRREVPTLEVREIVSDVAIDGHSYGDDADPTDVRKEALSPAPKYDAPPPPPPSPEYAVTTLSKSEGKMKHKKAPGVKSEVVRGAPTKAITLTESYDKSIKTSEPLKGGEIRAVSEDSDSDAIGLGEEDFAEGAPIREDRGIIAPTTTPVANAEKAGILTATEVNDFSKWNLWNDLTAGELNIHQDDWKIIPSTRYSVQVENEDHIPVVNAVITLFTPKKEVLWIGRTDNTGKAELWANIFENQKYKINNLSYSVEYNGNTTTYKNAKTIQQGVNIVKLPVACNLPKKLDVAFVIDATGSMQDEIDFLKAELQDIIGKFKDSLPNIEVNAGSVFYKDSGDDYLTQSSPLSKDIAETVKFVQEHNADGGGDTPEAVEAGLDVAINRLAWRDNTVAKILFLILDAPPHNTPEIRNKMQMLIEKAAKEGIRIIPVACSGIDKGTEYLMRTLALATNGTYIALTDDSGVGNSHIKPSTDKMEIESLNHLMMRVMYQYSHTPTCIPPPSVANRQDTLIVNNPHIPPADSLDGGKTGEPQPLISWKYYPNPTKGIFYVEIIGNAGTLYVSDLTGKIIQRYEVGEAKKVEMNIAEFPNGIYLIRYEYAPDKWLNGKIILVH